VRERLFSIGQTFRTEFPVYVLFTKLDGLPNFAEFFARMGEAESGQVFGVIDPEEEAVDPSQVWANAQTKRLNRRIQSLFLRLSDCRLMALTKEQEAGRKQAIYEFPREFKKIRVPLVQFLVDLFKPDPLIVGPRLRGFFFTGVRKTERSVVPDLEAQSVFQSFGAGSQPTRMFAPEMTSYLPPKPGGGRLVDSWILATDFFHRVLTQDRPVVRLLQPASKLALYRQIILAGACCLAALLALIWTISWIGNRRLIASTESAVEQVRQRPLTLSLETLQPLDKLRQQLEELERDDSLSLHWGLYVGDSVEKAAQAFYFERLK